MLEKLQYSVFQTKFIDNFLDICKNDCEFPLFVIEIKMLSANWHRENILMCAFSITHIKLYLIYCLYTFHRFKYYKIIF